MLSGCLPILAAKVHNFGVIAVLHTHMLIFHQLTWCQMTDWMFTFYNHSDKKRNSHMVLGVDGRECFDMLLMARKRKVSVSIKLYINNTIQCYWLFFQRNIVVVSDLLLYLSIIALALTMPSCRSVSVLTYYYLFLETDDDMWQKQAPDKWLKNSSSILLMLFWKDGIGDRWYL